MFNMETLQSEQENWLAETGGALVLKEREPVQNLALNWERCYKKLLFTKRQMPVSN